MAGIEDAANKVRDEELSLAAIRDAGTARRSEQAGGVLIIGTILGVLDHPPRRPGGSIATTTGAGSRKRRSATANCNGECWFTNFRTTRSACWIPVVRSSPGMREPNESPDIRPRKSLGTTFRVSSDLKTNSGVYRTIPFGRPSWTDDMKDKGRGYGKMVRDLSPMSPSPRCMIPTDTREDFQRSRVISAKPRRRSRSTVVCWKAAPDAMSGGERGAGDIVLLNVQAERRFGYSRDELLGQPVKNIIPEWFRGTADLLDGTRSTADALAQQIGTGIELYGRRKSGGDFPIEIMLSPLESADGILVTAAIRDISVRKAAEKHLAQMEERYRGLLEAAPDAMVVVNQGRRYRAAERSGGDAIRFIPGTNLLASRSRTSFRKVSAERLIADGNRSASEATGSSKSERASN